MSQYGTLEIVEIVQLGTMLFFSSITAAFLISIIFTELDKMIEQINEPSTRTVVKFIELYIQLIVTAIAYFYIEKTIYVFPSISKKINKNYPSYKSTNYVIHIILIIMLVEMNESLVNGLHFVAKTINITRH